MSDGFILTDSFAWIDFLHEREGEPGNQFAVKTEKHQQQINLLVNSVTPFPPHEFDWVSASCHGKNLEAGRLP